MSNNWLTSVHIPIDSYTCNRLDIGLKYMEFEYNIERCILRAHMYEVTCLPCGIRERFSEEDEAIKHAYNHERVLTHSTSSGYFVSVNEV